MQKLWITICEFFTYSKYTSGFADGYVKGFEHCLTQAKKSEEMFNLVVNSHKKQCETCSNNSKTK